MIRKHNFKQSALSVALVAASCSAFSQNSEFSGLEEIVVTAERRSQSIQELAIAATAMTGSTLEKNQIHNVDDLVKAAPALTVNERGLLTTLMAWLFLTVFS